MKNCTRAEKRRFALEKQLDAINLTISQPAVNAIPFVNTADVQEAARQQIAALNEQAAPLKTELKQLEYEADEKAYRERLKIQGREI